MSRVPRLLAPDLPASGRVRLSAEESGHLRVLRARAGDPVRVFDGRGRERAGVVVAIERDGVVVELREEIVAPRPAREVALVTAIPRGERMEWLVEKAVEAGASSIVPLAAERSVRKDAGENARRRWARAAAEASKQCGRADVPDVAAPTTIEDAIERTAGAARLVADPRSTARVADVRPVTGAIAVFVGPEGGFGPQESTALAAAGAAPFGLGPLILRVETAAVVAVHLAADGRPGQFTGASRASG